MITNHVHEKKCGPLRQAEKKKAERGWQTTRIFDKNYLTAL